MFGPVVKADVESLYPSIMLENGITSRNDVLQAFPLSSVISRLDVSTPSAGQQPPPGMILLFGMVSKARSRFWINSFFGYLGFGRGRFNDSTPRSGSPWKGSDSFRWSLPNSLRIRQNPSKWTRTGCSSCLHRQLSAEKPRRRS